MIATRQVDFRANLKKYFDIAHDTEPVIVTRKENRNVVVVSESEFNEYLRLKKNAEFLEKLDKSLKQLDSGETVALSIQDLLALGRD